jgi:hypothetical protein
VPSLHDIADLARRELTLCGLALDGAQADLPTKLLALPPTVTAPRRAWKLFWARRHRARAVKAIDELHMALHDRASLGVQNADLWSAIMRSVDALALSRWLRADTIAASDVRPARQTLQILITDLGEVIALIGELEAPSA